MAVNVAPQGVLPMYIQQAAIDQQLGPFTKIYKNNRIWLGYCIGMYTGLFILFLALDVFTIRDNGCTGLFYIMIEIFLLAQVGFMIYTTIRIAGRQIYLFQQGLIFEHRSQMQVIPWSQVAEVWQSITRQYINAFIWRTTYKYWLCRVDGYQIMLDYYTKDISELGTAVTSGITRELLPRALYAIRAGQTLTFGKFSVNTYSIGNGHEFIPWQQVQAFKMDGGNVTIKKAGKFFNWGSARIAKIPNFFVFLAVMEEMQKQAGGNQAQY